MKKITKRERFESLLKLDAVKADSGLVEFIEHEIELLAKKNTSDKKPTAQQKLNDSIKVAIAEGMEQNMLYTVTEIIKKIPACADLTNQRVSALLRQMASDGQVERIEEKRKAYFKLISLDSEAEEE